MESTIHRLDGRSDLTVRNLRLSPAVNPHAEGSALAELGRTQVLAVASIIDVSGQPDRLQRTVTRCALLPRATALPPSEVEAQQFQLREIRAIEQICDRTFAAAVAAAGINRIVIEIDCSVLCADGGVACAAVAAGWVALYQALGFASRLNLVDGAVQVTRMAAISAGIVDGRIVLDLAGAENGAASFRGLAVFDSKKRLVAFDGHSDGSPPELAVIQKLLSTAQSHVTPILSEQERAILQISQ